MSDLLYKDIDFAKIAVDFKGSEALDKAKRNYLIFFTILMFIEFCNIEILSVSLAVVQAKIHRPWVVVVGFWLLFIYTMLIYYLAAKQGLAAFTFKNKKVTNFYYHLTRRELSRKIYGISEFSGGVPGSASNVRHDNEQTEMTFEEMRRLDNKELPPIDNFDWNTGKFKYMHTAEDKAFFDNAITIIKPAVNLNYLMYLLPLHVGYLMIIYAVITYGYKFFEWIKPQCSFL